MSWEDINKVEPTKNPQKEQIEKFCFLCNKVFTGTPEGEELLGILQSHLLTAVSPPDAEIEGKNNLIRQFINAIELYKKKGGLS